MTSLVVGARPAEAHATLLSTSPADDELLEVVPEAVELTFDEPVEVAEGAIQVIDPSGDRADRGNVETSDGGAAVRAPIGGTQRGTYTVAWRVLSEDGHNIAGTFVFHVAARTGAAELDDDSDWLVDAAGGTGRFLGFAGGLAVVGAGLILMLTPSNGTGPVGRRMRWLTVTTAGVGTVAVALLLVSQAAKSSGRSLLDALDVTWDLSTDSRTGRLTIWRGITSLGALVVAAIGVSWRRLPWAAPSLALVGLALLSGSGHAWTSSNRAVAVISDVVHLFAVAVWVGGLVALLVALPVSDDPGRLARRFSTIALGAAGVVALSGTVSGLVEVGSFDGLVDTGYGQLLLLKIAGFLVLVGLGWFNRTRLLPAVERVVHPLVRSLRAEVAVAAAVLVVTALLVNQPPARDEVDAGPFETRVSEAESSVQVLVDPAEVGTNDVHLWFYDATGTDPLAVDATQITAASGDLPPRELDVRPYAPNHVSADNVSLSSAGTWTLVITTVSAGTTMVFRVEVPIR